MNSKFYIEEYSAIYQKGVLDLILQIQQKEYDVAITKEDQPDLLEIEEYYQKNAGNFWVAIYDQKVIGTISLLPINNQQVALRKLFVEKRFRGSDFQVSKALLEMALKWARNHHTTKIFLGTTSKFVAAHRFYEKNGFEKIIKSELPKEFIILPVDTVFYQYSLQQ